MATRLKLEMTEIDGRATAAIVEYRYRDEGWERVGEVAFHEARLAKVDMHPADHVADSLVHLLSHAPHWFTKRVLEGMR